MWRSAAVYTNMDDIQVYKLQYVVNGPKPSYMLNLSMKVMSQLSIAASLQHWNLKLRNLIYTQSFDEYRNKTSTPQC